MIVIVTIFVTSTLPRIQMTILRSSAKSNGTGLPVDLNNCNIHIVNNLDDQIVPVCKEANKVNNEDFLEH